MTLQVKTDTVVFVFSKTVSETSALLLTMILLRLNFKVINQYFQAFQQVIGR